MKTTFAALAAASALWLGGGSAWAADAAPSPAPAPAAIEVLSGCAPCAPKPCCPSGWAVWGEALMVKFHPAVATFAVEDTDNDDEGPDGRQYSGEFDYELGFRFGVGYRAPGSKIGVGMQVTFVNTELDQTASAPAGGAIGITNDTATQSAGFQDGPVTYSAEIDYLVLDLGLCYHICLGDSGSEAKLFAGLRFASIEHSSDTILFDGPGNPDEEVVSSTDLTGFGLAMGGELRYGFCGGWSVFGRAATGILLSTIDARMQVFNDADRNDIFSDYDDSIERITPFVEMGVGIGWGTERLCGMCVGLQIDLGFELTNWFNVLAPAEAVDDVDEPKLDSESDDLGLSAFTLKFALTF